MSPAEEIAGLKARVAELEAALHEVEDVLVLSDPEGQRAKHIRAPEDPTILQLCEEIGFGAVMDSAARQWRNKDELGAISAHTTGAAVATVVQTLALVRRALAQVKP